MAYLRAKILIYSGPETQITLLLAKKINVLEECADFSNVLFKEYMAMLSNFLDINKYITDLKLGKQLSYKPIYNLGLIELKTL